MQTYLKIFNFAQRHNSKINKLLTSIFCKRWVSMEYLYIPRLSQLKVMTSQTGQMPRSFTGGLGHFRCQWVKLHTFLYLVFESPCPPEISDPFCGGSMDIFWNYTILYYNTIHVKLSKIKYQKTHMWEVSHLPFIKSKVGKVSWSFCLTISSVMFVENHTSFLCCPLFGSLIAVNLARLSIRGVPFLFS